MNKMVGGSCLPPPISGGLVILTEVTAGDY